MKATPTINRISASAVRAFAFLMNNPGRWFAAAELREATGAAESTIYHRFANLASAGAVFTRRRNDFRQFCLHPDWPASALACELHRRALRAGLINAPAG